MIMLDNLFISIPIVTSQQETDTQREEAPFLHSPHSSKTISTSPPSFNHLFSSPLCFHAFLPSHTGSSCLGCLSADTNWCWVLPGKPSCHQKDEHWKYWFKALIRTIRPCPDLGCFKRSHKLLDTPWTNMNCKFILKKLLFFFFNSWVKNLNWGPLIYSDRGKECTYLSRQVAK